jgi:hypothetical protein
MQSGNSMQRRADAAGQLNSMLGIFVAVLYYLCLTAKASY